MLTSGGSEGLVDVVTREDLAGNVRPRKRRKLKSNKNTKLKTKSTEDIMAKDTEKKGKKTTKPEAVSVDDAAPASSGLIGGEENPQHQMFAGECPHCSGPFFMLLATAHKGVAKSTVDPESDEDDEDDEDEETDPNAEPTEPESDAPPEADPAAQDPEAPQEGDPEVDPAAEENPEGDEDKEGEEEEEEPAPKYQQQSPALKSSTDILTVKALNLDDVVDMLAARLVQKLQSPAVEVVAEKPVAKTEMTPVFEKVTQAKLMNFKTLPETSFLYVEKNRKELPYKNAQGQVDLSLLTASARMYVLKSIGNVNVPRDAKTYNEIVLKMVQAFKDAGVTPPEYLKTI